MREDFGDEVVSVTKDQEDVARSREIHQGHTTQVIRSSVRGNNTCDISVSLAYALYFQIMSIY